MALPLVGFIRRVDKEVMLLQIVVGKIMANAICTTHSSEEEYQRNER